MSTRFFVALALGALAISTPVLAASSVCTDATRRVLGINVDGDVPLGRADSSHGCKAGMKSGDRIPDPACTPGAYNPTVTLATLKDPRFKTLCLRNQSKDGPHHGDTYDTYSIAKPTSNKPPTWSASSITSCHWNWAAPTRSTTLARMRS